MSHFGGYNYLRLRDAADAFGFSVDYHADTHTVVIESISAAA